MWVYFIQICDLCLEHVSIYYWINLLEVGAVAPDGVEGACEAGGGGGGGGMLAGPHIGTGGNPGNNTENKNSSSNIL